MSKKRKTNHQDYHYVVESIDTFDWDSKPDVMSEVFITEQAAVYFKNNYCLQNNINSIIEPFKKVVVKRVKKPQI